MVGRERERDGGEDREDREQERGRVEKRGRVGGRKRTRQTEKVGRERGRVQVYDFGVC